MIAAIMRFFVQNSIMIASRPTDLLGAATIAAKHPILEFHCLQNNYQSINKSVS